MMKKKLVWLLSAALCLLAAAGMRAQTPEETVQRMMTELNKGEELGMVMDMEIGIPILGKTRVRTWMRGNSLRIENVDGKTSTVTWMDGKGYWSYDPESNTVTIEDSAIKMEAGSSDDNLEKFMTITEGYDLTLERETADAWYIRCLKSRDNKNKDDLKRIDVAVYKSTYLPVYLKAKQSGISIVMDSFKLGVSPAEVTFDPNAYPGLKVVDKRK